MFIVNSEVLAKLIVPIGSSFSINGKDIFRCGACSWVFICVLFFIHEEFAYVTACVFKVNDFKAGSDFLRMQLTKLKHQKISLIKSSN